MLEIYLAGCFFTAGGLFQMFNNEDAYPETVGEYVEAIVMIACSWFSLLTMIRIDDE